MGTENNEIDLKVNANNEKSIEKKENKNMLENIKDTIGNAQEVILDTAKIAQEIYDYTSGYPFLVSRICQIIDLYLVFLQDSFLNNLLLLNIKSMI